MVLKKNYLILLQLFIILFSAHSNYSQGGDLIIQQYQKNNIDLEKFKKWNFELSVGLNYFNTIDRNSKGRINYEIGGVVYYMIKKSIGIKTGIEFLNYSYKYNLINDKSIDKLNFIAIPLNLRVFPTNKFIIDFGISFNMFIEGLNSADNGPWERYNDGIFSNSVGFLSGIQYNLWRKFSVEIKYRYQKNSENLYQKQTNNLKGITLGINYPLFNKLNKRF